MPSSVGTSMRREVMRPSRTCDAGGEDAVRGDAEAADAFFDDPVVGGADGPDVGAGGAEVGDEGLHLGEDLRSIVGGEEVGGGAAQLVFAEAGVDLDHLAANLISETWPWR